MTRSRRPLVLASVVGVAALSLLATGCGGKSGAPGVASVASSTTGATTTTPTGSGLVGYAACMRANGVRTFPDPDGTGGIPKPQVVAAAKANPHRFDSATTACQHLLPANGSLGPEESAQQQRTRRADGLSFARCMRSHGVSRFPDPTAQGQLTVEMVEAQGIDVHSSAVLHVVQTCLPASHGGLTAAKVRAAINGPGG